MNEGERVVSAGGEFAADGLGIDGLAPFELEGGGLFAAADCDVVPFVGERAVHADEHLLFDDVAEGTFHDAPRAAGGQVNGILGVAERLKLGLHGIVERDEIGAAVPDHGLRHGAKRFFRDGDGAGNEEFVVHRFLLRKTLSLAFGAGSKCKFISGRLYNCCENSLRNHAGQP